MAKNTLVQSNNMRMLWDKYAHILLCVVISFRRDTGEIPALRVQSCRKIQTAAHREPCQCSRQGPLTDLAASLSTRHWHYSLMHTQFLKKQNKTKKQQLYSLHSRHITPLLGACMFYFIINVSWSKVQRKMVCLIYLLLMRMMISNWWLIRFFTLLCWLEGGFSLSLEKQKRTELNKLVNVLF